MPVKKFSVNDDGSLNDSKKNKKVSGKPDKVEVAEETYDKKDELKKLKDAIRKTISKSRSVAEIHALVKPLVKNSLNSWRNNN